jgi:hypothetical protein
MEKYFFQPDLSLEERQKRREDYLAWKSLRKVARVSPGNVGLCSFFGSEPFISIV